jgi:hypothetical protein
MGGYDGAGRRYLADCDELVEVERALNEMATRTATQDRRQAAQHAATRVLAE